MYCAETDASDNAGEEGEEAVDAVDEDGLGEEEGRAHLDGHEDANHVGADSNLRAGLLSLFGSSVRPADCGSGPSSGRDSRALTKFPNLLSAYPPIRLSAYPPIRLSAYPPILFNSMYAKTTGNTHNKRTNGRTEIQTV